MRELFKNKMFELSSEGDKRKQALHKWFIKQDLVEIFTRIKTQIKIWTGKGFHSKEMKTRTMILRMP